MPLKTRSRYKLRAKSNVATRYRRKRSQSAYWRNRAKMVSLQSMRRFAWPVQAKQTFKYTRRVELTIPNGTNAATFTFRANGPQDPEQSAAGDNAYGWDQFMGPLYGRCRVYAAKCTFTPLSEDTGPYYAGVHVRDNLTSTTLSAARDFMCQPNEPFLSLGPSQDSRKIVRYVNIKQRLPEQNENNLSCGPTTNPASEVYFVVWVAGPDPLAASGGAVFGVVEIEYYCILSQPEIVPTSM